ncbi:MAG: hypothetical protein ACRCX8_16800, partial [Sarcina sp.]
MCLYKKSNFENMQVSITTEQLRTDIKIIDLSVKVINAELKKMIECGFLNAVKKGARGNCSVYQIVKFNDKSEGNYSATNRQVKGKLKDSDCNGLSDDMETNRQVKGKLKATPIKEKEKEKNIYSDEFNELWNLYPRKVGKPKAFSIYKKLVKKYEYEKIKEAIEVYLKEIEFYKTDERFIKHGSTFFNCLEEDYIIENKKAPTAIGGNKKTNYDSSICKKENDNTEKIKFINNFS